jgi:acyl-CoA thioester hydrolase
MSQPSHTFKLRVYFEDTDAGKIVYYANYLKFMERARTEMLRSIGASHAAMMEQTKAQFVVHKCAVEYLKPARLDEELAVKTRVVETGAASLSLEQQVWRENTMLVTAQISLACINENGEPCRIPAAIRSKIETAS